MVAKIFRYEAKHENGKEAKRYPPVIDVNVS
jgi:hypothetical protein